MSDKPHCFRCNKELSITEKKISFREECPHCRSDVHVCKNCEFYDQKSYNECRETSAEVVRDKEKGNYCEYFSLRMGAGQEKSKADALRAAAEALFKK